MSVPSERKRKFKTRGVAATPRSFGVTQQVIYVSYRLPKRIDKPNLLKDLDLPAQETYILHITTCHHPPLLFFFSLVSLSPHQRFQWSLGTLPISTLTPITLYKTMILTHGSKSTCSPTYHQHRTS